MTSVNAFAGGILTNTNQSVLFLKNPARDASIGLDGVYSNPAGVVFMPEGFHVAFNWQYAHQTRTIESTNPVFMLGKKNNGKDTKTFEGIADAPCIPSLQAAYNKGNWSVQFNFSIPGGGGACEFDQGLGSFESAVGTIASMLNGMDPTVKGYDVDGYMRGRQYYFGFQLGAAYKINEHWAVYGGLRLLYGNASYKARLSNIQVMQLNADGNVYPTDFSKYINSSLEKTTQLRQKQADGVALTPAEMKALALGEAAFPLMERMQPYSHGVNLMCNQEGFGIAPIIGVDYRVGNFNFAAKYEFNTEMNMKNRSTLENPLVLSGAFGSMPAIENINKFVDDAKVGEDAPALLALGAEWSVIPQVRLSLGYHHYYDKNAKWYNNTQDKLSSGTNEYLGGVEWDITDRINISAGGQITRYGLTDEYMNDLSFIVNSYSAGFGITYKCSDHFKLSAAYFQTNYDDYTKTQTKTNPTSGTTYETKDVFTRTNRVLGLGCQVDF